MKDLRKALLFVSVAVITLAIVLGVRSIQNNAVEKSMQEPTLVNGFLEESVNYKGDTYIIPPTEIYEVSHDKNAFPEINEPKFDSVAIADEYLADDVLGVDVEVNGKHRFYSYQILNWHIVVNDNFDGEKIAITHCPFCRSPRVYNSSLNGEELQLSSSNKVYNNNLLLKDNKTNSLWNQMRGVGVTNNMIGKSLEPYAFEVMSWKKWKDANPSGEALSRDTGFVFDYTSHPYNNYDMASLIYFPLNTLSDQLGIKWPVNGLDYNNTQIAFAQDIMKGKGMLQVNAGNESVVGLYDMDLGFTRVYLAQANGNPITFEFDFDKLILTDKETGSHWNANGLALNGELSGTQLTQLYAPESFYFCWASNFPNSIVAGVTKIEKENAE